MIFGSAYGPENCKYIQQIPEWSYLPNSVKGHNNQAFRFWERALFMRASSVIDLKNLPDIWNGKPKEFLYYCLFRFGFVAVTETPKFGLIFNPATLRGVDLFYQPTNALMTNKAFGGKSIDVKLGVDGELIRLTPDYYGIYDLIVYYAEKLALNDSAINTSLINSKIPYILGGKTRAAAESLKKLLDRVNRGEPSVIYDQRIQDDTVTKDNPFQQVKLFSGNDYITDKLLMNHNDILNAFDAEIGIPVIPNEKKERMITDEANSRKIDATARINVMIRCLNDSMKEVNNMFKTDMSAEYNYKNNITEGVDPNERKNFAVGNE